MKIYEVLTILIATASLFTSIATVWIAILANSTSKKIAKRQGVIDLHFAWSEISDIDFSKPVVPDIVKAVNALDLTASLWNHDIMLKPLIYQSYWISFRDLYDKIYGHDEIVAGLKHVPKSLITNEISLAYEGMKSAKLREVLTTKL